MKNDYKITVKYGGDLEEIRADVLLPSLLGYINVLEEINRELKTGKSLKIYIQSTKKGSFLADINLVLDTIGKIKSLFGDNLSQEVLGRIIETAALLIGIKIFLKGEKPKEVKKEGSRVIIVNGDGNTLHVDETVYKIAKSNETIDEALSKMAEPIENDESIQEVEISGKDKTVRFSKEETEYLKKPNPLLEELTRAIKKDKQLLSVLKVVFAENRKWEFIYEGRKISAYIKDEEFLTRLDDYSFTRGTKMICDLEILQIFDREIGDFINREYEITKVYEVIPPYNNKNLF